MTVPVGNENGEARTSVFAPPLCECLALLRGVLVGGGGVLMRLLRVLVRRLRVLLRLLVLAALVVINGVEVMMGGCLMVRHRAQVMLFGGVRALSGAGHGRFPSAPDAR